MNKFGKVLASAWDALINDQPVWLKCVEIASIVFSVLAIANSIVLVILHLRRNKHAVLRKTTIRILLMVPLFTLTAFAILWLFPFQWLYESLVVLRDLYESVVIFSFLQLVITYCGGVPYLLTRFETPAACHKGSPSDGPPRELSDLAERGLSPPGSPAPPRLRRVKQIPLLERWLPPWRSAEQMLGWCIAGVLMQVVVSLLYGLLRAVLFLSSHAGACDEKCFQLTWQGASLVLSCSQGVAVTALLVLAVNVMEDLKPIRPKAKFLSIKAVVFFTFWQGIAIYVLSECHALDPLSVWAGFGGNKGDSVKNVGIVLQQFLLCLEMCVMSFVHLRVFPPEDYLTILAHQHVFHGHAADAGHRLATPNPFVQTGPIINVADIFAATRYWRSEVKEHRCLRAAPAVSSLAEEPEGSHSDDTASLGDLVPSARSVPNEPTVVDPWNSRLREGAEDSRPWGDDGSPVDSARPAPREGSMVSREGDVCSALDGSAGAARKPCGGGCWDFVSVKGCLVS
jgi:hypothetical protein